MPLLLATTTLSFAGFGLLLPVSPAWVLSGGADDLGAGLVTAVLMLFTVLTQLQVNRLLRRVGWGPVLAAGVAFLGAPAPFQALSPNLAAILALSALRGIGFGILTVCGSTALTLLVVPQRRGRAVGAYGLAVAVPQVAFTSAAPWLVAQLGYEFVLILGVVPVLALCWVARLGHRLDAQQSRAELSDDGASPAVGSTVVLTRAWAALLALAVVTSAGGVLVTFSSQIAPTSGLAALCLLCLTGAATPTRWAAGALTDRFGTRMFTAPAVLVAAIGVGGLTASTVAGSTPSGAVALLVGATLLGVAYGTLQTVTLVRAFDDAGPANSHRVSVAWNVVFDLGTGFGALLIGAIAGLSTYTLALGVIGVVTVLAALTIGALDAKVGRGMATKPEPG